MKPQPLSSFLLFATLFMTLLSCEPATKREPSENTGADTVALLQAVLDYPEIKNDYMYFQGQPMKLVQGKVVRPDYELFYRNKSVEIVQLKEEGSDIGRAYPKQFYVGLPVVRIFSRDSAQVVCLSYAGSTTSLFTLKQDDCSWKISSVVYGKY